MARSVRPKIVPNLTRGAIHRAMEYRVLNDASTFPNSDSLFRIVDNSDNTKQLAFEVSGISTATTRTITMPDYDVNLGAPVFSTISLIDVTTPAYSTLLASDSDGTALTADRTLTFDVNNANRNLLIEADSMLNQDLTTDASPTFAGATLNGDVDTTAANRLFYPSLGANSLTIGGSTSTVIVSGDFTVNGTTVTIDAENWLVEDKNITMGNVTVPSDSTADGGGITLLGTTDKTIIWDNANDNWTVSEHWNIATGKELKFNNVKYLTESGLADANVTTEIPLGDASNTALHANYTATSLVGSLNEQKQINADEFEPTGFINTTDSTVTWSDSSPDRTLTIAPAVSTFGYYIQGIKYTKSGSETVQIANTEGSHFIYYDGSTLSSMVNPTSSQIETLILTKALVAYVYWDATNSLGQIFEERHGIKMDASTHLYLHGTIRTAYESGLAIGDILADENGSSNTHAQFSVATGEIHDEDISITTNTINSTTGLEIYYLDGANWRWTTNAGYSVLTTGTGRLAYNNSGSQTEVTNGRYVLCHVFASNNADGNPFAVQGQSEYTNIISARDGATTEIASLNLSGLPSPEMKAIGTVIFQTSDSYSNAVKARIRSTDAGDDYVDFRVNPIGSGSPATDHGSLSGLGDDDHLQYPLLLGRSGGQTLIGGTDSGDDLTLTSTSNATKGNVFVTDHMSVNTTSTSFDIAGVATTGVVLNQCEAGVTCLNAYFVKNNDGADVASRILMMTSRGTKASQTVVADNDSLACIDAAGYDGTDYELCGQIDFEVDGTPGSNDMPGRIVFKTTPDGSNAPAEVLRLTQDKIIQSATTAKISTGGETAPDCSAGGITLQQNAEDTPAFTIKSTDIAHGITDRLETDSYVRMSKAVADTGGLRLEAATEDVRGMLFNAFVTNTDATNSTTADATFGAAMVAPSKKSGTVTDVLADADNLFVVINYNSARHIVKGSGTTWSKSAHLYGDQAGIASTNTFTGATDTPTTDPGWASSSTVDMNAPDGYMKAYVGTQAVVIPYWNT